MSRPPAPLGTRVTFGGHEGDVVTVCHGGIRARCTDGRIRFAFNRDLTVRPGEPA